MPRWPEDSRRRLIDAALTLFDERGFAESTVDDIALRAGVTSRTFFRHFADKDEVLFGDDDDLLPLLIASLADGSGPVGAEAHMRNALLVLAADLEPRRDSLRRRQQIIDSQISLSGRELAKQALWQQTVTRTLVERGFPTDQADVLAAIGFALFRRSLHAWLADDHGPSLGERVSDALTRVRTVLDVTSSE
ncbi:MULTISPECIES: TetR family transcriptional regulator [unclassified Cryobacterium]|jgi:AcrR family transcriptional regulator|uniref:TetR family transcriptional regulator n=1 Tax=unclassified Cryobacterium TaxID=2649013 RepID=UPI002AB33248|nr:MULTISPECIES: TetR family transcriptional regulator [unclassified Cryobacterium]MDY7543229.1 TetR family transcriptional regulator [Cryobacterium sp. 5B3]MEA9998371.1 TetR family transcriptional regulator [Cryobacterium sp. RTS3]MEB0265265.1 TetR family transcriptional regulator [Cryobacterium sp. 10I5]MEB0274337.1 TetR family transcriptional regulator [Cryobacterium sp. 5B3]